MQHVRPNFRIENLNFQGLAAEYRDFSPQIWIRLEKSGLELDSEVCCSEGQRDEQRWEAGGMRRRTGGGPPRDLLDLLGIS